MKRLLVGERNGRLGSFAKPILISSLTRPGGTRQGGPPRAHAHGLLTAARRPRSTSASTRSARTRTHRKTRSPSGRAELHTCLGASTRRRLTPSPSRFTAEESGQFNRRPQRPLPRSSSAASHRCPRRSPRQFLQRLQRPTSRGSHRQGPDLRFGPRGLNKAEPRSKSSSNPPQSGYIVKPPPPQVAQAAAASAATPEAGTRFRSPPRRAPPAPPPPPPPPERSVPPKELVIALDWHGVLDVGQQGPHLNPEVIRHLIQFAADYAPINFIVLSFVGRAASEYRRREFQVALEHARTTTGLTFSAIKIVHERLGRGGKADALQGLGVHALIDDTASIVREAQKTGIAAFRNYPHFGPGGFGNALENLGEFIESRNRQFIPAARGLHPSQYLEEIHRSASQLPASRVLR